jgi:hypothetical protein
VAERGEEQALAKLARANEKLVLVVFILQLLNKPRLVHVAVPVGYDAAKVGIPVW